MKNKYILKIGALLVLFLIIQSCAIPKIVQKEVNNPLPEVYKAKETDTLNTSAISWRTFFEDENLVSLIDSALENNKEINILLQKIVMAQNEIQVRKGEYLPFVKLGTSAELEKVGRFTRNGAVEENLNIEEGKEFPEPLANFNVGLHVSWELDVWKKLRNAKKVAVMEYLATVEGKNLVVTNIVAEIANSYYELLALDNELKNLEKNINIQKDILEIIEDLKEAGRVNSLAIKRFEAEVKKNQSELYIVRQKIVETENKINFLVGRMPQKITRTSTNFIDTNPSIVNAGIPSQLLENRPDIRKAELELAASKLNIKVARANFYPSFGINGRLGYESFDAKNLLKMPSSLLYSLAADAVAPLLNRNAIKANYENANAQQTAAVYEYEQTLLNAYQEVTNQLSNIENLNKSYDLKKQQVASLTESISIANQLFQSARADYMEVLLTQRDALEARNELIHTKKEQFIAMILLYKALGGGWK